MINVTYMGHATMALDNVLVIPSGEILLIAQVVTQIIILKSKLMKYITKHSFWSRGCKDIRGQSWRSKKMSAHSTKFEPG